MGRGIHYCKCGEEIHDEMEECNRCFWRDYEINEISFYNAIKAKCIYWTKQLSGMNKDTK